jgi:outer membrane receptor protein involved in Fe transport
VRYFGPRDLIEDGSEHSDATTLVNARVGYEYKKAVFALEVFNLFNSKDDDITYLYDSQLAGEPGPVTDEHFHPVEPRSFRVSLTLRF